MTELVYPGCCLPPLPHYSPCAQRTYSPFSRRGIEYIDSTIKENLGPLPLLQGAFTKLEPERGGGCSTGSVRFSAGIKVGVDYYVSNWNKDILEEGLKSSLPRKGARRSISTCLDTGVGSALGGILPQ